MESSSSSSELKLKLNPGRNEGRRLQKLHRQDKSFAVQNLIGRPSNLMRQNGHFTMPERHYDNGRAAKNENLVKQATLSIDTDGKEILQETARMYKAGGMYKRHRKAGKLRCYAVYYCTRAPARHGEELDGDLDVGREESTRTWRRRGSRSTFLGSLVLGYRRAGL